MNKVDVVLGLQWGDEGKGKIADFLTPKYDIVARFQGGPNAGHSLEFNGTKHVLNTIPSGIFHPTCLNLIGNGVVIDPVRIKAEIERIQDSGIDVVKSLRISRKAHIILPTHRLLDAASEFAKGNDKIGSTLRGIGPTYRDKIGRNGLRIGDLQTPDFKKKYEHIKEEHIGLISFYQYSDFDLNSLEAEFFEACDFLKKFTFIDSEYFVNQELSTKKILAEGAQGSMLDIDFGSYPYVTSSNTSSGGACTGLGIAPQVIGKVSGIFKAYCTRVGSGPFPTELEDEIGENLRKKGNEFGATTGRPRRCGWLDLVALRYAIMLSGVNELIMMKSDVLSGFETVKVCTGYNAGGIETDQVPFDLCTTDVKPVYKEFKGWEEDITVCRNLSDLPENFMVYLRFLEKELNMPISIISVGPDREQTIMRLSATA
ncbi:MAG: adenylosuccinate synthase [Bacteroidia bacterium]|nr:adenylosuccinate synthase [Bacteroidia bacterium]